MLRDAWDDVKLRVSISWLYWLYMQNNTILMPIHDEKIYTENIFMGSPSTAYMYTQDDSVV